LGFYSAFPRLPKNLGLKIKIHMRNLFIIVTTLIYGFPSKMKGVIVSTWHLDVKHGKPQNKAKPSM